MTENGYIDINIRSPEEESGHLAPSLPPPPAVMVDSVQEVVSLDSLVVFSQR